MSETKAVRGPDILVRAAPPLSATSDAPLDTPDAPPVSASNDPADQDNGVPTEMSPEAQAVATRRTKADAAPDAEGEKPATAKQPDPDPDLDTMEVDGRKVPTPPWAKREITKARNKQREAQTLADTHAKELADLRAKYEDLASKIPAPAAEAKPADTPAEPATETQQPAATEPRPTRDQFDDPDSYDTALTEWAARDGERRAEQKMAAERAAAEAEVKAKAEEATKAAQEAEIARINGDWLTRKAAAEAKYPDYKEITESDDLKISAPMAHAIMMAPNGPEIAYHLGKNATEAERIANLANPAQQVMEIGMIAEKISATPVRSAPRRRPLDPIDSGTAPADMSGREESMEEVARRVNMRYQTERKPFLTATEARR